MKRRRGRRWLQYNLRTLLVLVTLVGAGAGYYAAQTRDYYAEQEAIAQLPFQVVAPSKQPRIYC
ncbi:MAG: hypothetical protein HYS13_08210 [Planctomycetia bacterium]|nr:hypothetical protein [Planctomycetia bacterium]